MSRKSTAKKVAAIFAPVDDTDTHSMYGKVAVNAEPKVVEPTSTTKGKAKGPKIELDENQQAIYDKMTTVSARIRYLATLSTDRGAIADFVGKRYQHVRNVLETPLKRVEA